MIRIPICFFCDHYSLETDKCPAHPEGFKDINLLEIEEDTDCGNGVRFKNTNREKYMKNNNN